MTLHRSGPLKRRTPLARVSKAKRAEIRERARWKPTVCVLASRSCRGPIDPHELVRRSQLKGAATDRRLVIGLCRHHHDLDVHKPIAVELGIRIDPHEWRMCGGDPEAEQVLLDAAAERRAYALIAGIA